MKHIIKKILKEEFENFEWINEIPDVPSYNGHPQGIVYVRNHGDIVEVCDIIEEYNLLSCGERGVDVKVRTEIHEVMDDLDENDDSLGLSISFFVEKPYEDRLKLGYWNYLVTPEYVDEFLGLDSLDMYNIEYEIYNLNGFKDLFKIYL